MVEQGKEQVLQVRDVSRDVEEQDLPIAIADDAVTVDPSVEDEAAISWLLPIPEDILPSPKAPNGVRKFEQCLLILLIEIRRP